MIDTPLRRRMALAVAINALRQREPSPDHPLSHDIRLLTQMRDELAEQKEQNMIHIIEDTAETSEAFQKAMADQGLSASQRAKVRCAFSAARLTVGRIVPDAAPVPNEPEPCAKVEAESDFGTPVVVRVPDDLVQFTADLLAGFDVANKHGLIVVPDSAVMIKIAPAS
jgi:hypothetical protein